MSDEMTLERFEELVAAYGAKVDNWPQEARTDMQHILENDARASAILARAARLDEALDDLLPDHMAVETRILQDMETFLDSDIIAFPQSQAMPRRALWSVATALADKSYLLLEIAVDASQCSTSLSHKAQFCCAAT